MTWKDKGKFTAAGWRWTYTGDLAFQGPDKYRFAVNGEVDGMKLTLPRSPTATRRGNPRMGMTQEIEGDKLEYFLEQTYTLNVTSLLPLLADKEFKLATTGEKDVNGKKAAGVKVTREKKPTDHALLRQGQRPAREERVEGEGRVPGVEGGLRGESSTRTTRMSAGGSCSAR